MGCEKVMGKEANVGSSSQNATLLSPMNLGTVATRMIRTEEYREIWATLPVFVVVH